MTLLCRLTVAVTIGLALATAVLPAQQGTLTPAEQQRRTDLEAELQNIAIVERRVMIPMKDGVRLATDIYRPKNPSTSLGASAGKVPIVFVKTPYNFNFWDVRNGVPADMSTILAAIKRGYAYVGQNERGHFYSEGNYDILGVPVRPGATHAAGGVGSGAVALADPGHHQERGRPARDLRRPDAGRNRRHDAAARAQLRRLAQGRLVARRHGAERARPVVHVVVRRLGGAEPRDVQSRAPHREGRGRESTVGRHRTRRALRLHPRHREHHCRRAQHGRRPPRLQRDHLWLL